MTCREMSRGSYHDRSAATQNNRGPSSSKPIGMRGVSGPRVNVCQAASEAPWAKSTTNRAPVRQFAHFAPARRIICDDHDMHDAVPIICGGWAASIAMLSDSSRQILSFLLPGDVILAALMVEPRSHYVIESITDVHYRIFSRAELKAMCFNQPSLIDKLTETWVGRYAPTNSSLIWGGARRMNALRD